MDMNFKQALVDASRQGSAERLEVITLNDYIDLVAERPTIAATAHQRVHDMIRAQGVADGLHGSDKELGLRRVLETAVDKVEVSEHDGGQWVELRKNVGVPG